MTLNRQLRLSGILGTVVFLVMIVSDVLMLTTLDFSRPYRFWQDAPGLPQAQVTLGYYLGELTIPFYNLVGWHLSLAARPAGRWASRVVLLTMAYAACLLMVWHASFAFGRSILRAEIATSGPSLVTPETDLAFDVYAAPLFRIGLGVIGVGSLLLGALILRGRTLYPRWAALALPGTFWVLAIGLRPHVPNGLAVVLGAGGWNVGGAAVCALSTAILWNRGREAAG